MIKNILISGILGGLVMFAMMIVFRFFLPIGGKTELLTMPDQVLIHAQLKERITKPGRYVCPYLPPDKRSALFPDYLNEPIFMVTYDGRTHGTVPGFASPGMLSFLLAPMAAAWLLSLASDRVLATYLHRVLFVSTLGLFIAVAADLLSSLTDELPFAAVAGKAVASVITWSLIGFVLAWRIRPRPTKDAPQSA
jgi:hypothetical protein